jgi:hypothetical protein
MLAVSSIRTFNRPAEDLDIDHPLKEHSPVAPSTAKENVSSENLDSTESSDITSDCNLPAQNSVANGTESLSSTEPVSTAAPALLAEPGHSSTEDLTSPVLSQSENDKIPDSEGVRKIKRKRKRLTDEAEEEEEAGEADKKRRRSRKKQFDIDAGDKVFTDNFDEVCKCECKYCSKVLTMDEFRVHLRVVHSETIHEYRQKFGEMEFVSLTYHR